MAAQLPLDAATNAGVIIDDQDPTWAESIAIGGFGGSGLHGRGGEGEQEAGPAARTFRDFELAAELFDDDHPRHRQPKPWRLARGEEGVEDSFL